MPPISRIYKGSELVYSAPDTQPLTAFLTNLQPGDRIELFRSANIRTAATISAATLVGVNPHGARGTILAGPTTGVSNSTWYNINFDIGHDGWCVSDNYTQITSTVVQTTPSYFKVNDRVRLFRAANSRSSAAIANNLLGVVPKDALGTITAGPTKVGTINWYRINFDTATQPDGFVASDNYVVVPVVLPDDPGDPNIPTPPPDDEPADQTVSNTAQLLAALIAAPANHIIACAPGTYTTLTRTTALNKTNVTIRPQTRSNPPTWSGPAIRLNNVSGVNFDGLRFTGTTAGTGVIIENFDRVTVRNCIFSGYRCQMQMYPGRNGLVEWNRFTGVGVDVMRIYKPVANFIIRNNDMRGHNIAAGETLHPDFIQFAVNENQGPGNDVGSQNVTIEYNSFIGRPSGYPQCNFIFSERAVRLNGPANTRHSNIIIRGNYYQTGSGNTICLGGTINANVTGNLVRAFPGGALPQYSVIGAPNSGGRITNCVGPGRIRFQDGASESGVTVTNYVQSSTAVPSGWTMPKVGPYGYN